MALTDENIWTKSLSRRSRSHIHWILQVIGFVFIIVGFVVMFISRDGRKKHFNSAHSIVGLISIVGIIVLSFSGVPALFAVKLRKMIRPGIIKLLHNFSGIACYGLGMVSIILSYQKKYFHHVNSTWLYCCIVSTYCIIIFSLFGALRSLLGQVRSLYHKNEETLNL